MIKINSPYITHEQEKIFDSRLSQIKNSDDYKVLIEDLIMIGNNKLSLPNKQLFIF